MGDFAEDVKGAAARYGEDVSELSIGLAIEAYRDIRHYPPSYDSGAILEDMRDNINKIAMAAVEIESKNGVEGQKSHNENGESRAYYDGIMAYRGVIGFCHVF